MKADVAKTKTELLAELVQLRAQVAALDAEQTARAYPQLELLHRASRMFNSTLNLDEVLAHVLKEVRELWDAVAASIWLIDAATGELVCWQSSGPDSDAVRGWRLMPRRGIAGWVARHNQSLVVPDIQEDARHTREVEKQTGLIPRALICVPLYVKERVIGVLQVLDTQVGRFDKTALTLLEPLAAAAANAVENARLYEQAQREIMTRENIEQRLRENDEMFRQMADNLPGVLWLSDPSMSRTYYASPSIEYYYGISPEQEYQHPGAWTNAIHPDDLAKTLEILPIQQQGWATSVEYRVIRPDGSIHWMLDRAFPIRDDAGKVSRVVAVAMDITQRKQMEGKLRAALYEKELLLHEVHHRVKNNLQVIISILELQAEYVQDAQVIQTLRDSQCRVRAIALVHENLYRAPDLLHINFAQYIENITGYLFQAYAGQVSVNLQLHIEDVVLDLDTAVPCGLIVNELVANALQHAFPPDCGAAEIRIVLQTHDDHRVKLLVADNGCGLPPEIELSNATSLGLELVRLLTRQIGGALEIERRGGTIFSITFPITTEPNASQRFVPL